MKTKAYLITGSEGFIGSNLYNKLKQEPHNIVYTFNEKNVDQYNYKDIVYHRVQACDCVFHVGAVSSTDASDVNEVMFKNYEFTKFLIDLCAEYNKRIVFSSSAAIYGNGGQPQNLYAWSKKAAEDYGVKYDKFVALRYFNVYGPGEAHKGKMASVAYQAFVANKEGKKFALLKGKPRRDFVYVDDVVSANLFASKMFLDKEKKVFDVGIGEANTFETVLDYLGLDYYINENKEFPSWYQYSTRADKEKFLPNWAPLSTLYAGCQKYSKFLYYR